MHTIWRMCRRAAFARDICGTQTEEVHRRRERASGICCRTMLGVTHGRGNTVDEVLTYLRRSVAADGTRPNGTIYFMWNKDVRSSTRDKCFRAVAAQINALGVPRQGAAGLVPNGAKDVAGMMVGASGLQFEQSRESRSCPARFASI